MRMARPARATAPSGVVPSGAAHERAPHRAATTTGAAWS